MRKISLFCLSFVLLVSSFAFAGPPANNPFWDLLHPPAVEQPTLPQDDTMISNTTTMPFLEAFLIVYEGDWIFVPTVAGEYFSIDIMHTPAICNDDETECCGVWELRSLDGNNTDVMMGGLFCIDSTYSIYFKDKDGNNPIHCIGVRGSRFDNSIHLNLPGYALDDPKIIECQTFRLVRPE